MQYDSIIIGSGLSGLSCALLLARSGRRVLVLEQHVQPGPVVRGFSRQGIQFDTGFHYVGGLGENGPFLPLFKHLGLAERLTLFPYARQGFDRLHIGATGQSFSLPIGYENLREFLGDQFPDARNQINAYMDSVEKQWCSFPYLDLQADIADFSMQSVHEESLLQRLGVFSAWPELQSLLSMHSLLYGVDPAEASFTLNAQVAGSYYHSVHGIVGGGRELIEVLLTLLAEAGGTVRCRAEVTGLLAKNGAVAGVQLADGEIVNAKEVIATLNPTLLPDLLPAGALRPAYVKRLKNLRQTCSAYVFFGRLNHPCKQLQRCNLFVQTQPGVFSVGLKMPLEQRSFYLAAAGQGSTVDTAGIVGIVPADHAELAEFSASKVRTSEAYKQKKRQLANSIQQMFLENCPELDGLELLELATPLTMKDYSLAPDGAVYGVGRFIGQYNPQPMTRLSGLYLSGQAVAAPGLLGTVVAAYLTCGSILGHEALRREIKACR